MVHGKGIYEKGKYQARISKNKMSREYNLWTAMLQRCYSEKAQIKHPTYKGCVVSDYFLQFQNFAEWCNNQIGFSEHFDMDKDLLYKGNKIYCPTKCVFVPQEINKFLLDSKAIRGSLPKGVSWHNASKKYQVRVSENNKSVYLGVYDDLDFAIETYCKKKESIARNLALKWKDSVDKRVFYALFNYKELID